MKKKTLYALLIVATCLAYMLFLNKFIGFIFWFITQPDLQSLIKMLGRGLFVRVYIIKPVLVCLCLLFVAAILTFVTIFIIKQGIYDLTTAENEALRKQKQEEKRQQKILQLKAKIAELKNEDDE